MLISMKLSELTHNTAPHLPPPNNKATILYFIPAKIPYLIQNFMLNV